MGFFTGPCACQRRTQAHILLFSLDSWAGLYFVSHHTPAHWINLKKEKNCLQNDSNRTGNNSDLSVKSSVAAWLGYFYSTVSSQHPKEDTPVISWTRERASPSIGHDVFLPLRCECDTLTCNRQPAGTESHEAPSPHLVCSTTHRHLCPTGNVSTGAIPIPNQQVPSRCLYSTVYSISIHELQIESVLHWFSD